MARRRIDFEDTLTYEIYQNYRQHALTTDMYPNPHAFWENILTPILGYRISWGSFQYHWMQLQIRKLVIVDEKTRAVRLPSLDVVEVDENTST